MKVKFTAQKVIEYPDLTPGRVYEVIGIEADDYRILNNDGQPYLYANNLFVMVDTAEPDDWVTEYGEEGERYAYPPELNTPGFFEDYFEGEAEALQTFQHCLARQRALRYSLETV